MARTSHIAKARKTPKFKVRQHNRCKRCGRPRGFLRNSSFAVSVSGS